MSRRLIVTADDVGMHPAMTAGAIGAHRDGIVTACSVVAIGDAFDDAVEALRAVPALAVGVHLALVDGRSLTGPSPLAPEGRLYAGHAAFVPRFLAGLIPMRDVERELRAQLERVLAAGLAVRHLNSHQHLHLLPKLFAFVDRLAAEHGIGYVRIVDDRGGTCGPARRASIAALSALGRRARRRARTPTNDATIGVAEAGHLTAERLLALLPQVGTATELITHPGLDDATLAAIHPWRYSWERETAALCDPRLRAALAAAGIELAAPHI